MSLLLLVQCTQNWFEWPFPEWLADSWEPERGLEWGAERVHPYLDLSQHFPWWSEWVLNGKLSKCGDEKLPETVTTLRENQNPLNSDRLQLWAEGVKVKCGMAKTMSCICFYNPTVLGLHAGGCLSSCAHWGSDTSRYIQRVVCMTKKMGIWISRSE